MEFKIIQKIEKHENFDGVYMESLHVCQLLKDDKMKTYCHPVCKNNCYAKQKQYFEQYCSFIRNPEAMYVERQANSDITDTKASSMITRYLSHHDFLNVWLRDVHRSTYQRFDFLPFNKNPNTVPKDVFNIFHSGASNEIIPKCPKQKGKNSSNPFSNILRIYLKRMLQTI